MRWIVRLFLILLFIGLPVSGYFLLTHPSTPLPPEWNPLKPLQIVHPVTPITSWKLSKARGDYALCRAALEPVATYSRLPDLERGEGCNIRNRVRVKEIAGVELRATETRCDTALVTAMWLRHGVQVAAQDAFNQPVVKMRTQGSYNCRNIAGSSRKSTHSTASALDVAGFTLADGRRINLIDDWSGSDIQADFLRRVRDSSCDWYATTLGPDYNRAHADHFHLQINGWGTCR